MKQEDLIHEDSWYIMLLILYGEKWTIIEDLCDCSSSTISRYRRLLGFEKPKNKLSTKQIQGIVFLRSQGHSLNYVSKLYEISEQYVSKLYLNSLKFQQ